MNNLSIYERVAKINRFIVRHSEFDYAFQGITQCMLKSRPTENRSAVFCMPMVAMVRLCYVKL